MPRSLAPEAAFHRRIAIVGAGTAGHIYPALVVGENYEQTHTNVDLLFIGTPHGLESRLIPVYGHRLHMVEGSPLHGVGLTSKLASLKRLLFGFVKARHLLQANGTKLVIGFGGYGSGAALLAGLSLGLRTVIHEANEVPGLTNKFLGRLVDRVYLGGGTAAWAFPKSKTLVTGNPIRPEIGAGRQRRAKVPGSPVHILVTGGSQGSAFLNRNAPELLTKVQDHGIRVEITHQTGEFDPTPVKEVYKTAGLSASVVPYIEDMPRAYGRADFAVACSGSQTIAELAASRLPALLVPLSGSAGDHQAANARVFAEAGGGFWVREESWNVDSLSARMASFLGDIERWKRASDSAGRLATPNAAWELISDCEALMDGRW